MKDTDEGGATGERSQLIIATFLHDAREATVHKRILALQSYGCRVVAFGFLRSGRVEGPQLPFEFISLGITRDRRYLHRGWQLLRSVFMCFRHAGRLRQADIIQARNLDMLALSVVARAFSRASAPIVYEALDVHRIFVGKGLKSILLRRLERMLLKFVSLLLVSSPEYMDRYFLPIQRYTGAWHLLENKLAREGRGRRGSASDFQSQSERTLGPPWSIGWFGVLRCKASLQALSEIAAACGIQVRICLRGRRSTEDIGEAEFLHALQTNPNMVFCGSYVSPDDLPDIYRDTHFVWAIDYTDEANSEWLLPNRIYEGCFNGSVPIARAGTATARKIEEWGVGVTLPEPIALSVRTFVSDLTNDVYDDLRERVAQMPVNLLVDETDTADYLDRLAELATSRQAKSLALEKDD